MKLIGSFFLADLPRRVVPVIPLPPQPFLVSLSHVPGKENEVAI